jgi:sulfonate transport system permease protein
MSQQAEVIKPAADGIDRNKSFISAKVREKLNDVFIGSLIPAIILVLWQILGDFGVISTQFLPTPLTILSSIQSLASSGELTEHLAISLQRAAIGFLIGGAGGLLFGFLVGFSQRAEYLLDPSMQMLRLIPHLAAAPLIILWFGFGETSKIFIIANGAFFPLYVHTFLGIRSVDNKLFEVSRVLEFSRMQQIFRLILPAALPNILLGLRLSLALSWLGLVVAELIGSQAGVGFLINFGKQTSSTDIIFVGVIIFAVIGKLVDSLVRWLDRRWLKWRDSFQG